MVTGSPAGILAPPFILLKGKKLPNNVLETAPPDYGYGYSDNGRMTNKAFYEFIANVFYPWLVKIKIRFPVILYLDGHASHLTYPLSKFCKERQIHLVALPAHASHIIQPLDVSFFRSFKSIWQVTHKTFCQSNGTVQLQKCQVGAVLKQALEDMEIPKNVKNGFRKCGLFPFDANAVNYKKILNNRPGDKN